MSTRNSVAGEVYMQKQFNKVWTVCVCVWSVPPSIDGPAEEHVVETISNPVTFACDATGIPHPSLTWLKNGRVIGENLSSALTPKSADTFFFYVLIGLLEQFYCSGNGLKKNI